MDLRKFLNEEQDPKAVEKMMGKLSGILMSGEEVTYIAVQKKPAVNLSPDGVALTNKRVIFCRPKNLGLSFEFKDFVWKDVADCHMKEGMLGAEFTVRPISGTTEMMDYLPKNQARRLYALAQEQEEKQRNYRREQELEMQRASSGSIHVNAAPAPAPAPVAAAPAADDPMATLQKLKMLFDNQLIDQEEYNTKKAEVLQRM